MNWSKPALALTMSLVALNTVLGQSAQAEMQRTQTSTWTMEYMSAPEIQPAQQAQPAPMMQPEQQPWTAKPVAVKPIVAKPIASSNDKLFDIKPGVSPQFIAEIKADAQALPTPWKNMLARAGYRITISKTLTDSVPAAKNQQVRGYKQTMTWNQVFGMFDRLGHRVVMAEKAHSADSSNAPLVTLDDHAIRAGIVRHEFGHAIDDRVGYGSHSALFKSAYDKGLSRLTDPEKKMLNYYLQPGSAGREEAFAEMFAALNGPACDPSSDEVLRRKFPEAMKLVRELAYRKSV